MFKFKGIMFNRPDKETGKTISVFYDIVSVIFSGDEIDKSKNGANFFEIGLNPVDDCEPIYKLTATAGNSGDWVRVQKNLNPKAMRNVGNNRFELDMTDAIIKDNILIVNYEEDYPA